MDFLWHVLAQCHDPALHKNYTQALEQTYSLEDTQLQSAYSQDMNWKLNTSSIVILCGMR